MTTVAIASMCVGIFWALGGIAIILCQVHVDTFTPVLNNTTSVVMLLYGMLSLVVMAANFIRIRWILRVSKNAHVLKGRALTNSPMSAALWWYVIPFMCLFRPWESLSEIWDASAGQSDIHRPAKAILGGWWILFLVASILGYIGDVSHTDEVNMIALLLCLLEYATFIVIARTICDMQLEKSVGLGFSEVRDRLDGALDSLPA